MTKESPIQVEWLSRAEELPALRPAWNALARGVPFRSWEWLESWWRAYGAGSGKELYTLVVRDSQRQVMGLAPWYLCLLYTSPSPRDS